MPDVSKAIINIIFASLYISIVLVCSPESMSYDWFGYQTNLEYLSIECDISSSIEDFLHCLPSLISLRVLTLSKAVLFMTEHFVSIISSLEYLEVKLRNHEEIF